MNILITNNTLTVKLVEDIDHKNALEIRKQIDSEIEKRPIKNLVFDFSKVEFMDSAGIGMILGRYKILNAIGGTVYIKNPTKTVLKIIEISGINKIIPIISNTENPVCEVK